jgi:hypothetical protein
MARFEDDIDIGRSSFTVVFANECAQLMVQKH